MGLCPTVLRTELRYFLARASRSGRRWSCKTRRRRRFWLRRGRRRQPARQRQLRRERWSSSTSCRRLCERSIEAGRTMRQRISCIRGRRPIRAHLGIDPDAGDSADRRCHRRGGFSEAHPLLGAGRRSRPGAGGACAARSRPAAPIACGGARSRLQFVAHLRLLFGSGRIDARARGGGLHPRFKVRVLGAGFVRVRGSCYVAFPVLRFRVSSSGAGEVVGGACGLYRRDWPIRYRNPYGDGGRGRRQRREPTEHARRRPPVRC